VLQINTPGGLDQAMRAIIQTIITSDIPVFTYVAPGGARAASAGAYILYASHVAAMAPGTNLGAATPVQISGGGGLPGQPEPEKQADSETEKPSDGDLKKPPSGQSAMEHKVVNDAAAYIRSLAQMRGRNVEWAEKFVREAASLSATDALEAGVIDYVADDLRQALAAADGRTVMVNGKKVTIHSKDLPLQTIEPDWRIELLSVIANPNVAYILILLGVYGLMFEFYNPGFVLPGVVGAIALVLALYALQVLPINYAGLALLILGISFMVAEAFAPSFGILGIGGIIAFVTGSIILIDTDAEGYGISMPLIFAMTATSALFLLGLIGVAMKARSRPVVSGIQNMLGARGEASRDFEHRGMVRIHGELWTAQSVTPLRAGQPVRVVGIEGLTLFIEPEEE
jgi:membrane-bound serine protease (ClpP class)